MLVKIRDFIRKYKQVAFFSGLLVVGVVFAAVGIISMRQPRIEGVETEGTIVEILKEEAGTNVDGYTEFIYTVYVDYTDTEGNTHSHIEYPGHDDDMVVGNKIAVKYDPANPDTLVSDNPLLLNIIFLAIGVGAVVISVLRIISTFKKKDINEFNKVDLSHVSEEEIAKVRDSGEEENEYYFHFNGSLNQSYILETMERQPVYEARCDKVGIVSKYKYTFINHLTGEQAEHAVSHVASSSFDNFVTSSNFKIDDVSVWDILGKAGYSLEPHWNGIKSYFDISRYGIRVAKIELAGSKAYKDGASRLIGDVPIKGMFKVYAKAGDIDMVFLCAFVLSRVELF